MTAPQVMILAIIVVAMGLFLWGRWRHDLVAVAALIACVLAGLVPAEAAFTGFGHPAVITVAAVLVLSHGLAASGAIDRVVRRVLHEGAGAWTIVLTMCALTAFMSAFMNNIGALALMMPAALAAARRAEVAPGQILMPLSFASILGGMTTLIGTPPNLIVAGFRAGATGTPFGMFDFAPVGVAVAGAGVLLVVLGSRFLVPNRPRGAGQNFDIGAYLTEARVPARARAVGMTLKEVEETLAAAEAQVVGLVRDNARIPAPQNWRSLREDDILVIEADSKNLPQALAKLGLTLEEDKRTGVRALEAEHTVMAEVVVRPGSPLIGRTAQHLKLRSRHAINLLAISRQGRRSISRLRQTRLAPGDVLLLQGTPETLADFSAHFDCVPLAERALRFPAKRDAWLATGIMGAAVAATALGILPVEIAFTLAALAFVLGSIVPTRELYTAVEWPVIVLLGALIPVAGAVASTGAADAVARGMMGVIGEGSPVLVLVGLMVMTMCLTDFMNNAATATVMCPIAIGIAKVMGASPDPFLMAVAIGSSCAFLTPIGHQNNTLILGPGGFRFGDYWRLGLPLEIVVLCVGIPMILVVWPL
ncbi:SLC13 family permease [Salinarimonas chemoclinalis]|uniref:SLC13 family permease n=1 Tax=Salinarimonas chemoclinalis TaxID=3241599 RepID=UPI00355745B2